MLQLNNIYNMDCLQGLKQLPDKFATASITDFPYNVNIDYGTTCNDKKSDEEYVNWLEEVFTELKRISQVIVFTCGNANLAKWIKIEEPTWIGCWYIKNALTHTPLNGYITWEPILIYGKPNKQLRQDSWYHPISTQKNVGSHPCPKPLSLYMDLVSDFTNENDIVIDPCCGSGTTLVACKLQKRKYLGFEINPIYSKEAHNRLNQVQVSKSNFGGFFK